MEFFEMKFDESFLGATVGIYGIPDATPTDCDRHIQDMKRYIAGNGCGSPCPAKDDGYSIKADSLKTNAGTKLNVEGKLNPGTLKKFNK